MKSFMDYLCLTIDQMIFQSLCCLEPMEIHNPVASSYYYTVVSVFFSFFFFFFIQLFIFNYYVLSTNEPRSVFSFFVLFNRRTRVEITASIIMQRVFTPTYVFPPFFLPSISLFLCFPFFLSLSSSYHHHHHHPINDRIILYFSLCHAIFEDFLEDRNDSRKSFAPNPNVVRRQGFMIFNSGYY